jgi:hypothetical protein
MDMFRRVLLTILVWGLILEILTFMYFSLNAMTWRFEFAYNLFLLLITSAALLLLLVQMRNEFRRSAPPKDQQFD